MKDLHAVSRRRIAEIKARIQEIDRVCSGTLVKRTRVCGRSNCRCARGPEYRHGPYYEWAQALAGQFTNQRVTPAQAHLLRAAIKNRREVLRLLRKWEQETLRVVKSEK